MKKDMKKRFLWLKIGVGIIILVYMIFIRIAWGIPLSSVVISNPLIEEVNTIENEIGFILPNNASIKSVYLAPGRDSKICVCLEGIKDIETFINNYVYVKKVNNTRDSFYSPLRKAWIYDCELYAGNTAVRDIDKEITVVGYYLNDEYYIEIYVDCIYGEDTYRLIESHQSN